MSRFDLLPVDSHGMLLAMSAVRSQRTFSFVIGHVIEYISLLCEALTQK